MVSIKDKLAALMAERQLDVGVLARDLAIERTRLSAILAGSASPNENLAKRLAKYFQQDPADWIASLNPDGETAPAAALPADFVRVASTSEIPEGDMKIVYGGLVVIAHAEGEFYAFGNVCPHAAGPIGDGFLEGCIVECPWHAGRWDVRTGEALTLIATADVPCFDLRVVDDGIEIKLTEAVLKQGKLATA